MTHLFKRARRALAGLCVILLACPVPEARAADPQGRQVLDAYATVLGKAYPVAGAIAKAIIDLADMAGLLGEGPDPLGQAVKVINARLDAQLAQLKRLEEDVRLMRGDHLRERNLQRVWRLRDSREALKAITSALAQKPADPAMKALLVGQAQAEVEKFLDLELWTWSDVALKDHTWYGKDGQPLLVKAGEILDPDFKTMPTLEYYTAALVTWMAAIEYAGDGNRESVKQTYGAKLREHAAFLSPRPDWNTNRHDPQSLPEHVQHRIGGFYVPEKYPRDGMCTFDEYLTDYIGRQVTYVQPYAYPASTTSPTEMCNVPSGVWKRVRPDGSVEWVQVGLLHRATAAEEALEGAYGAELMALLARKLTRLGEYGTTREQFIGQFDPTIVTPAFLYGSSPAATCCGGCTDC